jgi:ABC-2 type transport system permease protein
MTGQLAAVLAIAQRDVTKLLRDRIRLGVSLAFPILIIAGLGPVLQPVLGTPAGLNSVTLLFTGVLAATLFQSAAAGMMSMIQDRETDFSQELFVSPVSRVAIVAGKVLGESLVALVQGAGVVLFALAFGVRMTPVQVLVLVPAAASCCLLGAAFGLAALAALPNQRAALQVFPFIILPQYFLAGVIAPVRAVPGYIGLVSWAMPLRYAVDLTRAMFFAGSAACSAAITEPPALDAVVMVALFVVLLLAGAVLFEQRERSR